MNETRARRRTGRPARRPFAPSAFALALVVLVLVLGTAEVLNRLARPMLEAFDSPDGTFRVVLVHRGAKNRAVDVFIENADGSGRTRYLTALFPHGVDREGHPRARFDELRWTRGGRAVAATQPDPGTTTAPPLLWLYDIDRAALFGTADGPPGEGEAALLDSALAAHGGLGGRIVRAGELGLRDRGRYLPVWRTRRYRVRTSH